MLVVFIHWVEEGEVESVTLAFAFHVQDFLAEIKRFPQFLISQWGIPRSVCVDLDLQWGSLLPLTRTCWTTAQSI